MLDTHCHLDMYPKPTQIAEGARLAGIGTVAVTNLPSGFEKAYPYVGNVKGIKLALGLHPLHALEHAAQLERFAALVHKTCYIGEVGLDFSTEGLATKDLQLASFRYVLRTIHGRKRFLTVHSRRAETEVLQALADEQHKDPIVFHWYSGTLRVLENALSQGHYFSVNPAMTESPHGRRIIEYLPRDRVLMESDGPFVQVTKRPALPQDVVIVQEYLCELWKTDNAGKQLKKNFTDLRYFLGGLD